MSYYTYNMALHIFKRRRFFFYIKQNIFIIFLLSSRIFQVACGDPQAEVTKLRTELEATRLEVDTLNQVAEQFTQLQVNNSKICIYSVCRTGHLVSFKEQSYW